MYIEKIDSPKDVKRLSVGQLNGLAGEIRQALLAKLSAHGGHIGPNLGMVEAAIALHYVFDSPKDKMVYDVSHQSYVHKMLTGRNAAFLDPARYDEVSGYTNPLESEHDFFTVGHTSTSVSLACGLAKARDLKGDAENIIAVIGDGSLSGGEAYEGLSNAGEMGTNLIVVVNDNEMSIAENHGGLYQNLKVLRDSDGKAECNFFRALGLDYLYVRDGNDVAALIEVFNRVKNTPRPTVVHIHTLKGRGYALAEADRERFHWGMPFDLATGAPKSEAGAAEDYGDLTGRFLLERMAKDPTLVAITSGTPAVMGFTPERRKQAGRQFVDVGIAEEHAVALASGIAANGGRPVYGVYSTFIQRCYDQLSQDLCINGNPAVIPVFMGTIAGMNDVTHLGFFDIPLISNIPNMVYLAPTCKEEYFAMLGWAIRQREYPVAVRVPGATVVESGRNFDTDYSELNRYRLTRRGDTVAVVALGSFYALGEAVTDKLRADAGIDATLINPRYITGVDEQMLDALKADHRIVVTLEDGVLDGGFGEKIARYYGDSDMRVLNYGVRKEFADRYAVGELLEKNRLTDAQIVEDIRFLLH
ncbi:1-deoxy-D-xylulose-5-phosphate synthase [Alistipes indistinctus]|jgi:1-deoxy-D-xylulose-5-phosphate synthase|uniref:1-deoxy-D-xylulose-5-phosphate synthase n=1 Tax=Alistipes indistinctus TaxID=626932 RepID=UPI000E490116|nr:1-deoxy-D-xylulose-5-phosphate synthase [Alistipes indistinctus]RGU38348.1 1-deoxy-D-xylulose-5-phosphate synthase [Alistipes indistinctus]